MLLMSGNILSFLGCWGSLNPRHKGCLCGGETLGKTEFINGNKDTQNLMNNRQTGRRRGRNTSNNSNRNQGNRGGVDRDNRIDNRARGNAAQMLEKYKKMAQDAQVNGDRVNAEYYHQFADHYFRVHADTQARREEQRQARDENRGQQGDRNDNSGDDSEQDEGGRQDRSPRARQQNDRQQNDRRPKAREERHDESHGNEDQRDENASSDGNDSAEAQEAPAVKKPVRARRPRKTVEKAEKVNGESNGFDASILPPAIAIQPDDSDSDADDVKADDNSETKKKPVVRKRRTVKAKETQEGDAAA